MTLQRFEEPNSMDNEMDQFAAYLSRCWEDVGYTHSYQIPKRGRIPVQWRNYREGLGLPSDVWAASSLKDAYSNYFWNGGYSENARLLDRLSESLVHSIESSDDELALRTCHDIFRWGNVARKENDRSRVWVKNAAENGSLCELLQTAVSALIHGGERLDGFARGDFPMNSSMTKIYALADKSRHLIIYDGRVGAALGSLAFSFAKQRGLSQVPQGLSFPWGKSQRPQKTGVRDIRDPSWGNFRFPALFGSRKDLLHAKAASSASNVISFAVRDLTISNRDFEAALFMWGYQVRDA